MICAPARAKRPRGFWCPGLTTLHTSDYTVTQAAGERRSLWRRPPLLLGEGEAVMETFLPGAATARLHAGLCAARRGSAHGQERCGISLLAILPAAN